MNIFWEFWNDLWYQGVPEKCHRSFVDAVSPDKICFFKIGIVYNQFCMFSNFNIFTYFDFQFVPSLYMEVIYFENY